MFCGIDRSGSKPMRDNIDERMLNTYLPLCYASIEDRIASMVNPSEMVGEIEPSEHQFGSPKIKFF